MTQYKRIAIDTSKAVFTLHGIDQQGRPVLRTNLRRPQLIPFFKKLPATHIAIEALAVLTTGPRNSRRLATKCV
jgi:transposase